MGFGLFDRVRQRNHADLAAATTNDPVVTHEKHDEYTSDSASDLSIPALDAKEVERNPDAVTTNAQIGQQKVEAAAIVWSKTAVYLTYAWIWVGFFMLALQSSIAFYTGYYATSTFLQAPQIAQANIAAGVVGGIIKLPIAKTLNLWGRAEGLLIMLLVYIIGLIVLASSNNATSYAAGYTIFYLAYSTIYYILDVFVADTSGLKNRAFAWAFASTPFICTAFTGPLAAQSIINNAGWRWSYGIFCIVQVFVFVPLAVVFKFYQRKAEKLGVYKRVRSGRSIGASVIHYFHEFDVIGALILMAAFLLFLLPFSLTNTANTLSGSVVTYKSATFIAMVVVGILLFPVFYVWERFFARAHFIRYELFRSRTVSGACVLAAILFFSFYCWDLFFYQFVTVVYGLNIADAGFVTQVYNIGSTFWGVVFGIYIRITKHFKWACFCFGLPLLMLGAGLLIHFRSADHGLGYVIMAEIFIAFGGGTLVIGQSMAVMAAADRDGVPLLLSLISLSSSIGGALGQAVSSAIYNAKFPAALTAYLPEANKANATTIFQYGYLSQTADYLPGTPQRVAIDAAWGESQKWGAVAATVVLVIGFPAIFVWKNYNVTRQQNKGTVI